MASRTRRIKPEKQVDFDAVAELRRKDAKGYPAPSIRAKAAHKAWLAGKPSIFDEVFTELEVEMHMENIDYEASNLIVEFDRKESAYRDYGLSVVFSNDVLRNTEIANIFARG